MASDMSEVGNRLAVPSYEFYFGLDGTRWTEDGRGPRLNGYGIGSAIGIMAASHDEYVSRGTSDNPLTDTLLKWAWHSEELRKTKMITRPTEVLRDLDRAAVYGARLLVLADIVVPEYPLTKNPGDILYCVADRLIFSHYAAKAVSRLHAALGVEDDAVPDDWTPYFRANTTAAMVQWLETTPAK